MASIFLFKPDYAEIVKDSFEWRTEVQRSFDGSEHRRQLREFPQRFIEYRVTLAQQDKQIFENWLAAQQSSAFYLPIWHEKNALTHTTLGGSGSLVLNTATSGFEDAGYALIYSDKFNYEIVATMAKTSGSLTLNHALVGNWQAGTSVYPLFLARLEESQKLNRRSSSIVQANLKFWLEAPAKVFSAASFTESYSDYPVLETRNNWSREVNSEVNRQLETLDFDVFGRFIDDESGIPTTFLDFHFLLKTVADRYAFIAQLYYLAGKWRSLWVPSGQHDFTLAAPLISGSSHITVLYSGISLYGIVATKQAIKITLKNGETYYRGLNNVINNGDNTETLTLDAPFSSTHTVDKVLIISYLLPMRLSADLVVLELLSSKISECSVTFQSVKEVSINSGSDYLYSILIHFDIELGVVDSSGNNNEVSAENGAYLQSTQHVFGSASGDCGAGTWANKRFSWLETANFNFGAGDMTLRIRVMLTNTAGGKTHTIFSNGYGITINWTANPSRFEILISYDGNYNALVVHSDFFMLYGDGWHALSLEVYQRKLYFYVDGVLIFSPIPLAAAIYHEIGRVMGIGGLGVNSLWAYVDEFMIMKGTALAMGGSSYSVESQPYPSAI